LPKIEGLSLQFNHFTDKGLEDVARLEQLKTLWVCGARERTNRITDAGLKRLEKLQLLTQLGIQNTDVTPRGVEEFLRAVPRCRISQ
jgi:hypothetical protein